MRREDGQTMAEYSVVLAVIGVMMLAAIATLSESARLAVLRAVELFPS